jgi:hypothetical protein
MTIIALKDGIVKANIETPGNEIEICATLRILSDKVGISDYFRVK